MTPARLWAPVAARPRHVMLGVVVCAELVRGLLAGPPPRPPAAPFAGRATVLEAPRTRSWGGSVAMARLGSGARALLVARGRPWPREPVGAEVRIRGRTRPLSKWESWAERRGAGAAIEADVVRATGRRRGGLLGAVDRARARAEAALTARLPRREGALLRGMVLGQDEAVAQDVRDDFRVAGLSHVLAASGENVVLLAALALPVLAALGFGLRGRLLALLALIALYVPAGGRRAVDPAGRDHGPGRHGSRAGGASRRPRLRPAARCGRHARALAARGRRPGLAALVRGGDRDRADRRAARAPADRPRLAARPGRGGRRHRRRHARHGAAARPRLRPGLARLAAGQRARRAGRRRRDVDRDGRHGARPGRPGRARPCSRCPPLPLLGFLEWLAHAAARRAATPRSGSRSGRRWSSRRSTPAWSPSSACRALRAPRRGGRARGRRAGALGRSRRATRPGSAGGRHRALRLPRHRPGRRDAGPVAGPRGARRRRSARRAGAAPPDGARSRRARRRRGHPRPGRPRGRDGPRCCALTRSGSCSTGRRAGIRRSTSALVRAAARRGVRRIARDGRRDRDRRADRAAAVCGRAPTSRRRRGRTRTSARSSPTSSRGACARC